VAFSVVRVREAVRVFVRVLREARSPGGPSQGVFSALTPHSSSVRVLALREPKTNSLKYGIPSLSRQTTRFCTFRLPHPLF